MNNSLSIEFGLIEGQTYIIGREGHIHIDSPSVSKRHAAMRIKNERIYLRDLKSTNGTYLEINNNLVDFEEGYVSPHQTLVIGKVKCTLRGLLEDWLMASLRNQWTDRKL